MSATAAVVKMEPKSVGIGTARKKRTSKGPDGAFLDGCPWDARIGFKMPV